MSDREDEDAHYRVRIGMLVRHPTLDLAQVLAPLGITPQHAKVAGEPRVAPNGRSLPGTYRFSFWTWSRVVAGDRDFAAAVVRLADALVPHRALFESVTCSGGSVAIKLALPGSNNIGATFAARDMAWLVDVGVDLDVEVFPHIGNFDLA